MPVVEPGEVVYCENCDNTLEPGDYYSGRPLCDKCQCC